MNEKIPNLKIDLIDFFDSIELNIQSDLSDWKKVRRELYRYNRNL